MSRSELDVWDWIYLSPFVMILNQVCSFKKLEISFILFSTMTTLWMSTCCCWLPRLFLFSNWLHFPDLCLHQSDHLLRVRLPSILWISSNQLFSSRPTLPTRTAASSSNGRWTDSGKKAFTGRIVGRPQNTKPFHSNLPANTLKSLKMFWIHHIVHLQHHIHSWHTS